MFCCSARRDAESWVVGTERVKIVCRQPTWSSGLDFIF